MATIASTGLVERRADQAVDRRHVGGELAFELEAVARGEDREAVVADRAGDDDAIAGPQAGVGHDPIGQADAGRVENDAVELAAAHHLRVAGDDRGARLEAGLGASMPECARGRNARNPSSRIAAHVRPRTSVAPIIARSLTVPETASRPMSPPGKKIGCTTCESVVTTSQRSPSRSAAPSSIAPSPIARGGNGRHVLREHLLDQCPHRAPARALLQT